MTQTLALLMGAYRELRARRLFWITLILSAVFIGAFALIGYNSQGLTVAGYQFEVPGSERFYKPIFRRIVIGFWLTWASMILALISTAGIFPDLLTSGTIDLYLARPISRLRLFLTKYLGGLMFVGLQVLVVSLGSFLVMGWRGHQWMPSLFWAIPLVVLLFSYLFALCVLLGVLTRSTVAALLLTIVGWTFFSIAQQAEEDFLTWQRLTERRVIDAQRTIHAADSEFEQIRKRPADDLLGVKAAVARLQRQRAVNLLPGLEHDAKLPRLLHRIAYAMRLLVPKTRETTDLLDRWLYTDEEVSETGELREQRLSDHGRSRQEEQAEAAVEVEQLKRHRSAAWIVGTSLLDEAIFLALGAWIFCRRDY
jgi:hypothetical protein